MKNRAQKLCELFADRIEIVRPFDNTNTNKFRRGTINLAAALGVDKAVVSRWTTSGNRGTRGRIPPQYNQRIVEAADARGIRRELLADILDAQECPCCKQRLPLGQFVEVHRL